MSKKYNPQSWFWIVAGDESKVYASERAAYLPAEDADYQAWLEDGGLPTRIGSEAELADVLAEQYPAGWPAAAVRQQRNALLLQTDIEINKLEDNGMDASAWRKYRQALRDVPEQPGYPNNALPKAPA